ncbi:alpha/beta fold hydrolase [Mucilaginibacter sp. NFX135]|uniref:alpha/beta fold hydrolase n=1 Tax=Mucilaginibacter sp. NFX135 TaxID=3402687 RepID=UPI003AFB52CD
MKKIKEIFTQVKELQHSDNEDITDLLWQLICYSPKFPLRLQQQQLLDEATPFTLEVDDPHFSHSILKFNGFIWGNGSRKVLITHGWSSKGADFIDLITALRTIDDLQIIAFDAPGNGSSEGELSNLLLFAEAVKAVIRTYGAPDIMICHSLGVMANTVAIKETGIKPSLLINITPMVNLKENFIATMNSADVPKAAQDKFFERFNQIFDVPTSYFNLADIYQEDIAVKHWLSYDRDDKMTPFFYMQELLNRHPVITSKEYPNATHERIIKDPRLIEDVLELVRQAL